MEFIAKNPKISQFAVLLVVFFALYFSVSPSETNMLWRLPSLFASFPEAINVFVEYLMYDWMPVEIYDPELEDYEESALIKEVTRGFSRGVLFCIEFIRDILLGGVKTIVAFTSWDFVGENKWAVWPALPWTFVSGGAMLLGYALKGRGLALLADLRRDILLFSGSGNPQWRPCLSFLLLRQCHVFLDCYLGFYAIKTAVLKQCSCRF